MTQKQSNPWLIILLLIFAGEMIFSLPFHITRYFRPTLLEVFSLSNAQLGDIFAVYGLVAMLAYFPGGALADRFSAKNLITVSLLATAAGGFVFANISGMQWLMFLYGFWGLTTILLFWAALIKATREWGGVEKQGLAFGIMDGGRGLVSALVASAAVIVFAYYMPTENITASARLHAIQMVVYFYSIVTALAAAFIYWHLPDDHYQQAPTSPVMLGVKQVLKQRTIWLKAVIIICAYCGFKGVDNYSLYAVKVMQFNEVDAAFFSSVIAYSRPFAAIAAGLLADRFHASSTILFSFVLLTVGYLILSFISPSDSILLLVYCNLIVTLVAVYGIRGIYFALVQESQVHKHYTGTAVGIISVVGFTPDIFFAPISGRILDAAPGLEGFQNYFLLLTCFSVIGIIATWLFARYNTQSTVSRGISNQST